MSCTCRTLALTARQATAQAARSRVAAPLRSFATSSLRAAAAQTAAQATASTAAKSSGSSCPAGTVLKGLNYLKDASDPVAMEDLEYPSWVWQLGQPEAPKKGKNVDVDARLQAEKQELKRQRKLAIKARNALNG
ncbi:ribosomal protein L37, mitochondrial [Rhodotorula toruloides]|uniref:Large ribosomal subunit protein mL54 n=1 Tax=Rhodotorula toruloides TaxID=5286 RepID=A0A511KKJ4_RHOTO|nr:ribosomal protein L37, mitochondrial [Rhodotorula toruloides]